MTDSLPPDRRPPVRQPADGATRAGEIEPAERRLEPPAKDLIATLPPFDGLGLDRIVLATTLQQVEAAAAVLLAARHLGFDTESKPTFVRGEVSEGPHLVQFATLERAYLFPLHLPGCADLVAGVLESERVTKVGFGLDSDRSLITSKLGVAPKSVLDLDAVFRRMGYRKSLGLKSAVAVVFGQQFTKSKKIGTSNWAQQHLSDRQVLYAANDAYAAMRVFAALPAPR